MHRSSDNPQTAQFAVPELVIFEIALNSEHLGSSWDVEFKTGIIKFSASNELSAGI